ncbi:MAG: hypothetical protein C0507_00750 [Cyanobacteria bacterium PR.3.49]|nr:hypothetical protein [Cyanobacteria bacterium PR.3.49]
MITQAYIGIWVALRETKNMEPNYLGALFATFICIAMLKLFNELANKFADRICAQRAAKTRR